MNEINGLPLPPEMIEDWPPRLDATRLAARLKLREPERFELFSFERAQQETCELHEIAEGEDSDSYGLYTSTKSGAIIPDGQSLNADNLVIIGGSTASEDNLGLYYSGPGPGPGPGPGAEPSVVYQPIEGEGRWVQVAASLHEFIDQVGLISRPLARMSMIARLRRLFRR